MDPSHSLEYCILTNISEPSSPMFLLERGLDYIQRGYYAEGAALFTLACEQLASGQSQLADILDAFLQRYTEYRYLQQELQEISTRFVEAQAELQSQATTCGAELLVLLKGREAKHHQVASPLHSLHSLSQDLHHSPSSLVFAASTKPSIGLPALFFTCFGRFEVRRSGKPIVLCPSRNGQCILRYLVAKSGHYATADTLQTLLWPEDEPEMAQRKLHIAISALRRSLNEGMSCKPGQGYIVCKNHVYHLDPANILQTDVDEFLSYYQTGQQKSDERIECYQKACRLYTGPFLAEDIYADWSSLQREQLSNIYLSMCRVLTDHYLQIQCYEEAIKWASAILTENHCDETAHQQLIRIYAAQGRRHEALQQYQRCERLLRDELGVQPLPETLLILQNLLANEIFPQQE